MGIYDRNYGRFQQTYQSRFSMSPLTPAVKWLLIINVAAFIISYVAPVIYDIFAVFPINLITALQPWRFITYQFLHAGIFHIMFNMIGLFFLGSLFERQWGTKYFLKFYLICGATGGILYTILALTGLLPVGSLVGASGAIYGLFAAAFIFYPRMQVYIYGIFPVQMQFLIPIVIVISMLGVISGQNAGGEAAHLAGLAAGFIMIKYHGLFEKLKAKNSKGVWQKKMQSRQDFQDEVNRILDKVNNHGIGSLTRKEKNTLKKATEMEQNR